MQKNLVKIYFDDVNKYPLLTADEEKDYAIKAKAGDELAKKKLIESNLRFVVRVAKNYLGRGLPLEDLISEGNMGLMNALNKYDPNKGYRFLSYAVWWIKQKIKRSLYEQPRNIRLPANKIDTLYHIQNEIKFLEPDKSRIDILRNDESMKRISKNLKIKKSLVAYLIQLENDTLSLNYPVSDKVGETYCLNESLEENRYPLPEEQSLNNLFREEISKIVESALSKQETDVIKSRFGLNGNDAKTLEELGIKYGVSRERIRQIENKALKKLENPKIKEKLENYLHS